MKIFVIIVTYNAMRRKWIDRCLQSLRDSAIPVIPVVIDNHSTDETTKHIQNYYPEVHLITNKENRGFGQANNQGIEDAYCQGATHFFLLNQDAWIKTDTISHLIEVQDKYHLGLVSPIHLTGGGDRLDLGFYRFICKSKQGITFLSDLILHKDDTKDFYDIEEVNAAAWFLDKKTIDTIGGFDPVFFHYGEDDNFLCRLRYHHIRSGIVPKAFIHHDRSDDHGNEKIYHAHQALNKLLCSFSDVNQSAWPFTKYRMKTIASHAILFIKMLFSLHIHEAWLIIRDYTLFLLKIRTVIRHKHINQTVGLHWPNLEKGK